MDQSKDVSMIRAKDGLITILMYTISFAKETLNITVHNQYPGLELISPVYCSSNATYCVSPGQQTDIGNEIGASFRIDAKQEYFKAVLLYKLQIKHTTKTDSQSNSSIEDTATNIYLLVAWDAECYIDGFCVCLLECPNDFTWDEDKLWTFYYQHNTQFYNDYNYRTVMWSMHDNTVMNTHCDRTYGLECKLNIVISEGVGIYSMTKPMKFDPERLVLP
jgi:hypothetical protein